MSYLINDNRKNIRVIHYSSWGLLGLVIFVMAMYRYLHDPYMMHHLQSIISQLKIEEFPEDISFFDQHDEKVMQVLYEAVDQNSGDAVGRLFRALASGDSNIEYSQLLSHAISNNKYDASRFLFEHGFQDRLDYGDCFDEWADNGVVDAVLAAIPEDSHKTTGHHLKEICGEVECERLMFANLIRMKDHEGLVTAFNKGLGIWEQKQCLQHPGYETYSWLGKMTLKDHREATYLYGLYFYVNSHKIHKINAILNREAEYNKVYSRNWYKAPYEFGMRLHYPYGITPDAIKHYGLSFIGYAASLGMEEAIIAYESLGGRATRVELAEKTNYLRIFTGEGRGIRRRGSSWHYRVMPIIPNFED